jgi:hypothetical protein
MTIAELIPQIQQLSAIDKRHILALLQSDLGPVVDASVVDPFDVMANQLADEFQTCFDGAVPVIPDQALTSAGIYEEHP